MLIDCAIVGETGHVLEKLVKIDLHTSILWTGHRNYGHVINTIQLVLKDRHPNLLCTERFGVETPLAATMTAEIMATVAQNMQNYTTSRSYSVGSA